MQAFSIEKLKNEPVTPLLIEKISSHRHSEAWFASIFLYYFGDKYLFLYQPTGDVKDNTSPSITDFATILNPPTQDIETLFFEVTLHPDTTKIKRKIQQYAALERIRHNNPKKRHLVVNAGALTQHQNLGWLLTDVFSGSMKVYEAQKHINSMNVVLPEGEWLPDQCPTQNHKPQCLSYPFIQLLINRANQQIYNFNS